MNHLAIGVIVILLAGQTLFSQVSPSASARDPQAVSLLSQSVTAMAAVVPSDSVQTGTVQIGSGAVSGSVQIQTLGSAQTSLQVRTSFASWTVVYSQGQATRTDDGTSTSLSLEATSTSQCSFFPLPFVTGILQNRDTALQFVGNETLNGVSVQHVRTWNTFQSSPIWQFLSPFTLMDIWLDTASRLPRRVSFVFQDGQGATPKIPNVIDFASYQTTGGVTYPTQISQYVDGTLWMTVSIQSTAFNTGLTTADFPVSQGGN